MGLPVRPYKFLDFYDVVDRDIFFGRRKETETLLADVLSARLVVLFAKTGTGKSSLINAGVRPRLSELNYDTVLIRLALDKDPAEAAMQTLSAAGLLSKASDGESLSKRLMSIVQARKKPLVLFFDQFEEFFLFTLRGGEEGRSKGAGFITEAATIYRNRDSGVHFVFSLREDYLAEMDAFRDEIPTIFHNDSQLRLRPFDDEQAKAAIEGPGKKVASPFEFEKGLVDRLVRDIPREGGLIALVPLQIVCDTLWRSLKGPMITHREYDDLGETKGILASRFEEDLKALDDGQLDRLVQLLPLLRTARDTKQRRTFGELQTLLRINADKAGELIELANRLRELRLIRDNSSDREPYIEWVSDYLGALSHELEIRVRRIALSRARNAYAAASGSDDAAAPITRERLIEILSADPLLDALEGKDWVFLLRMALAYADLVSLWFAKAAGTKESPWAMMRTVLDDATTPIQDAEQLVTFLGQLRNPQSLRLLERVRGREELEPTRIAARHSQKERQTGKRAARAASLLARERSISPAGSEGPQLRPGDWEALLASIQLKQCVPFVGPGVGWQDFPSAAEIAREWAERYDYPLDDPDNLARVAQYLSNYRDPLFPKEEIAEVIRMAQGNVADREGPFRMLAELPIPIYLTTGYDNRLANAIRARGRNPVVEVCAWNPKLKPVLPPVRRSRKVPPSVEDPLIFHLYGDIQYPESLVLTEEDLLNFLTEAAREEDVIPLRVQAAVGQGRTLFLGYALENWTFQVLLHSQRVLERSMIERHFAIQLSSGAESREPSRLRSYLEKYYHYRNISVFWGSVEQFLTELVKRWRAAP